MTTAGDPFLNMFRRPANDGDVSPASRGATSGRAAPPAVRSQRPLAVPTDHVPADGGPAPRDVRRVADAVARPARGLSYPWSERAADERTARRDARRGRPDIDLGAAWTPYMSVLVAEFGERALAAYLATRDRCAPGQAVSARTAVELRAARVTAERAARYAHEARTSTPAPAGTPTSRVDRIQARRDERARAARLARLDEAMRAAEDAVTQREARVAEIAADVRQATDALRGEWDLLAAHALRRLSSYVARLTRDHPDGDRMQSDLLGLVELQVADLRDRLEEVLAATGADGAAAVGPDHGDLGPAVEAG